MKRKIWAFLLALSLFGGMVSGITLETKAEIQKDMVTERETVYYLSDLKWDSQNCGAGNDFPNGTAKDSAVNGSEMKLMLNGEETTFEKGLGAHAPSEIVYDIEGMSCTKFEAYAGVDYQCLKDYHNGEAVIQNFIVEVDGVKVAESGMMNPSMDAYHFVVDVPPNSTQLTLKAEEGENDWSDWIIWADAKIIAQKGNVVEPVVGPTLDPLSVNNLTLQVVEGDLCLYLGDVLVGKSASLGKVNINGTMISDFVISDHEIQENVITERGKATRLVLEMTSAKADLTKTVWYDLLNDIEGAVFTTTFVTAAEDTKVTEIVENEFVLVDPDASRIWSYNGGGEGSQSWYDTLQKVNNSFSRENRQDETAAAIPVADIYSVNGGITVGDASLYRRFLSTPVKGGENTATVSIKWQEADIKANEMTQIGTAIIGVHSGDYYSGLRTYADVMAAQGFAVPEYVPETSYDLRWESWGWEGAWTIDKILGKLDDLYAQGIRQITLDDCWYTAAGDWELNPDKFPNGAADMKRLTDAIHEKGMTIVLWWRPMDGGRDAAFSVISGHVQQASNLVKEHPEYFVKNQNGTFARLSGPGTTNSFNGSTGYALCPYSEGAVQSQVDFVRRAMTEWGIDGFKSDYVWGMPKCYNKEHNHASPNESTEMASEIFYKAIYEEMISINPDAFHLLCNCGTPQDYYSFPYVTQIPTADPTSVDQTRRRVKAYKALAGDDFPITTDHNEIWYPSSVGTGAILIEKRDFTKGSAQEAEYYKWLAIAEEHQLQKGTHVGDLYAYGIDSYETYVIEKDDMMYYSFYKDGNKYRPSGNPAVELKGLDADTEYRIEDYVNGRVIAESVLGSEATFTESFSSYLLLRAIPLKTEADKDALNAAIEATEKLNADDYKDFTAVAEALAEAKEAAESKDVTQEEVDAAVKALDDAVAALEEKNEVVRLYGKGRYETGYAVADALKAALGVEKFEAVVVATGKNFADALAGSYLAVEKNAPILLTNGNDDNVAALHAYIAANVVEGGKVYVLGGEAAVPVSVEEIDNYKAVRLSGDSRYDTNLAILKEAGITGDSIIVATGRNFADSLSASAAKLPILLVKPDAALTDVQKEVLAGMKNIYIVGGEGAVSADYEAQLKVFGEVKRVYGASRYETSVEIAKTFCDDVDLAVVASGKNFPDGLCGGPFAAALGAPLVLTKDGGAGAAAAYAAENAVASGYVLGGEGALADETVVEVFDLENADEIVDLTKN